MGKTVRASSAASRSVKEARGGEEESTSIYWSWTPTHASFSPPPSCCSTSSTGWATSTFSTVLDHRGRMDQLQKPDKNSDTLSHAEGGRRTKTKPHPTFQTGGRLAIKGCTSMVKTQGPLTVPSSGGVDSVCYNNQGNWFIKNQEPGFDWGFFFLFSLGEICLVKQPFFPFLLSAPVQELVSRDEKKTNCSTDKNM